VHSSATFLCGRCTPQLGRKKERYTAQYTIEKYNNKIKRYNGNAAHKRVKKCRIKCMKNCKMQKLKIKRYNGDAAHKRIATVDLVPQIRKKKEVRYNVEKYQKKKIQKNNNQKVQWRCGTQADRDCRFGGCYK